MREAHGIWDPIILPTITEGDVKIYRDPYTWTMV